MTECSNKFWDTGTIKSATCCKSYYQNGEQVGITACGTECYSKKLDSYGFPAERKCSKDELNSTFNPDVTGGDGLSVDPDIK